ncbi:MAG: hypothetical protein KJ674_04605 [Nanoarchaeota archaeon]|nr:hypothetical protein [Nanoarchaeota archaeon]
MKKLIDLFEGIRNVCTGISIKVEQLRKDNLLNEVEEGKFIESLNGITNAINVEENSLMYDIKKQKDFEFVENIQGIFRLIGLYSEQIRSLAVKLVRLDKNRFGELIALAISINNKIDYDFAGADEKDDNRTIVHKRSLGIEEIYNDVNK